MTLRCRKESHMPEPSRFDDIGGIPRWVKVFGILALVVALLVVVMLLIGGGGHGPQRHGGAGVVKPISLNLIPGWGRTPWHKRSSSPM
jgi:hypothetical protein